MTEPAAPEVHPSCPWCSAELPSAAATTCPSCGATLIGEADAPLPGLTAIDADAIVRGARTATPQRRSRLMSWITGDELEEETPAPPGSLALPPPDVRREMLRMELEAEVADLQAEAESLAAAAREEGLIEDAEALEAVAEDAAAVQAAGEVDGVGDVGVAPGDPAEAADAAETVADDGDAKAT